MTKDEQHIMDIRELIPSGQAVELDVIADQLDLPPQTIRKAINWLGQQKDYSLTIELQKEMIRHE